MKRTHAKSTEPAGQSVFHKVAENLYRLESSGGYYALVKRAGKQFRRSLKTKDRKLAERRLGDLKAKVGALRISDDADLNFRQVANYWNEATKLREVHVMVWEHPHTSVDSARSARFLPLRIHRRKLRFSEKDMSTRHVTSHSPNQNRLGP